jgi:hypothetical protein
MASNVDGDRRGREKGTPSLATEKRQDEEREERE